MNNNVISADLSDPLCLCLLGNEKYLVIMLILIINSATARIHIGGLCCFGLSPMWISCKKSLKINLMYYPTTIKAIFYRPTLYYTSTYYLLYILDGQFYIY